MRWIIGLVLVVASFPMWAQNTRVPILEKRVTIRAMRMPVKEVMDILEEQAEFSFSYSSSIVNEEQLVSVRAEQRPLREVLGKIFGNGIRMKERGKYIILSEVKEEKKVVVGGYVENENGDPVRNVTIYDERTLVSANTDEYGYYEMKLDRKLDPVKMSVRKTDYHDTIVPVRSDSSALSSIIIRKEPKDSSLAKTLNAAGDFAVKQWSELSAFMFPENPETINVNDTIYRHFQFSLLPFVGTNRDMCGNVINDWSFNLLGGYNRGIRKGELGGFLNMNREGVKHAQLAGFANINGGEVEGAQAAGFCNLNNSSFEGAQLGGFANINHGESEGMLAAGFANILLDSAHAALFAGFSNVCTHPSNGSFISGFTNVNVGETRGAQIAGFANISTGKMDGTQVAGFANIAAKDVDGVQVSGFANVAHTVRGSQISFINYCDSTTGIPVGFLSYVNKGYHSFDIGSNDLFHFNLSFRSGVRPFYNIFTSGIKLNEVDTNFWSVGYGIGTSPRIMKNVYLNFELTSNHISRGRWNSNLSLDNQAYIGVDIQLLRHLAIAGGPVLHGYLTDSNKVYPSVYNGDAPRIIEEHNWDQVNMKMWLGWRAGLRVVW